MVNVLICNGSHQESQELREKTINCCRDRVKAVILFDEKETFLFYLEEHISEPNIIIIGLDFCKDGLKIAEKAKALNPWSEIIFLCNNGRWTMDVYNVDHIYGLECPLSEGKIKIAITRALDKIGKNQNSLFPIKKKGITYALHIKDIQYLEQDKRVIHLHTDGEIHTIYVKFSEIEKYRTDFFIRCHSSYAVNFLFVKSMTDQHFIMKNGKKIPISRSRKDETRKSYEAFISREPVPSPTY